MKLYLDLDLDNAAFAPLRPDEPFYGGTVALAVNAAIGRIRRGARETPVMDVNGNTVGVARVDG